MYLLTRPVGTCTSMTPVDKGGIIGDFVAYPIGTTRLSNSAAERDVGAAIAWVVVVCKIAVREVTLVR